MGRRARRPDRARPHALLRRLGVDTEIDDASVVTSVLEPGTFPAEDAHHQGFGRVDHRFNSNNVLDARYSLTRNGRRTAASAG